MTNEVEEYRTLAERRREEIEALHVDFKRLTEQLAEANAAKCEALVRSEDIGNVFLPCSCFSISPTGTIPRALGMICRCLISLFDACKWRGTGGKVFPPVSST